MIPIFEEREWATQWHPGIPHRSCPWSEFVLWEIFDRYPLRTDTEPSEEIQCDIYLGS
ncbi:hypothetical protein GCM10009755_29920 [Brevibacterium samyangense]|uniref:Uncharacterized protein n=1 Tax=Brevibacterium samyangense TaxID=366888 RepID=A0ABN2TPU7_9MICO